jgi:uridine kinase
MDEAPLKRLELFAGLGRRDLRRVARLTGDVDVTPGRTLCHAGALAYALFVIVEGTAAVTRDRAAIAELGPGDCFGEIAGLDGERRRTATVAATSAMRLATLQRDEVRALEVRLPEVARQIRAAIERRL